MAKTPIDIRSLARAYTKPGVKQMGGILTSPSSSDDAKIRAFNALMDRGWGKAPTVLQGDEDGGRLIIQIVRHGDDPDPE